MKLITLRLGAFFLLTLFVNSNVHAVDKYLLNAGDILDISVWKEESLQKTVVVLPDGMISFPLAGEQQAVGKSVTEIEQGLKKSLAEYIEEPLVTVVVASVNGNTVHVLGKALTPGSFVMSQQLNVVQALSLAGGLSPYAEENNIIVLRQQAGGQKVIPVRYADIKKGRDISSNITLKSGDVIVIP